VSLIVATDQDL